MEQSFHAQLKNGNSNSEMQETKYLANGACVYPAFLLQPVSKAPCHSEGAFEATDTVPAFGAGESLVLSVLEILRSAHIVPTPAPTAGAVCPSGG
jgi:hypothetical protein